MSRERRFRKEIASLDGVFAFLAAFSDGEALGAKVSFALDLVVEELFTNMVKYNVKGGEEVLIGIARDGDHVLLEMTDFDVDPFDPEGVDSVRLDAPIEDRREGGLGLHLVKSMVNKISYEYKDRTMKISVVKHLE